MIFAYIIALVFLTIFSFGFIDANFSVKILPAVFEFIHSNRPLATYLYVGAVTYLFIFYFWILRQNRNIWKLIFISCAILFFSFPAFSYDIFNYMATAKVAYLYKENPYVVMPIEFPNEPMLSFLHAANKVALYGPTWIALTYIPHIISGGNILVSIWAFKALAAIFYLGVCWILWKLGGNSALAFFALNPLVITETLVSGHNDIVMMFFGLLAFYFAKAKRWWLGLFVLVLSIFVKGATIILLPLYFLNIPWNKKWLWAAAGMFIVFLLTPLREELYPWYFIWPLTFIALLSNTHILRYLSYGFSIGLPLRFAPFIYYGDWSGVVPIIKKIVSSLPPALALFFYAKKRNR
ncbi:hypothetical protein A3A79_04760 [Candidatus Gottesmanbacteria bacterium RIFCSPLOWO2_01_FULL_43_11b]|uniref:Glycosyltransferase RgtA/B/C/D-like domain-containing protein n=1 Tax=Candidatus Gottesmanbacteria bacterium RIFCSPLOWO2_01_FULL_43_11b TaxID=1798392 RepID=A0A1F6AIK4_9BACT|nr:MAG: hypothetical protein A3A79_04760 [Candidatus Gottesmanbacteria bacterium RIFCSPLOWO2_01_FULL_43_11b]